MMVASIFASWFNLRARLSVQLFHHSSNHPPDSHSHLSTGEFFVIVAVHAIEHCCQNQLEIITHNELTHFSHHFSHVQHAVSIQYLYSYRGPLKTQIITLP